MSHAGGAHACLCQRQRGVLRHTVSEPTPGLLKHSPRGCEFALLTGSRSASHPGGPWEPPAHKALPPSFFPSLAHKALSSLHLLLHPPLPCRAQVCLSRTTYSMRVGSPAGALSAPALNCQDPGNVGVPRQISFEPRVQKHESENHWIYTIFVPWVLSSWCPG